MAQYDLTQTLVKYLDRHLGFPLLSHLGSIDFFPADQIAKAQYELAKGTSMVDYAIMLYEQAYPGKPVPSEFEKQRQDALTQNERLGREVENVLNVIEDPNVAGALKQDKVQNLQWLEENYKLTLDQINALYRYGHFHFSCGNYGEASSYLYHFRVLSTDPTLTMSSHWGKLASDILTGEWDRALEEVKLLRDQIDGQRPGAEEGGQEGVLQKRTWLLHWSLFVWFNHPSGREGLVEMYLSPPYLNTIQTTCWWLLRYLVASLVITRRTTRIYTVASPPSPANPQPTTNKVTPQAALRDVTKIINSEGYRLKSDPILDFVKELYTDFDFERAQEELAKAQEVAAHDFFLQEHADAFVESARFLVSEAYCRIHQRVDIADLSVRLNMSKDEGEKWIVNLIRDTRADAKIDFKENMVHMNQTHPAVYQSVIEKTRGFTFRTAAMAAAMDKKAHPGNNANESTRGSGRGGRGGGRGGGQGRGQRGQQQQQQGGEGQDGAPTAASQAEAVEAH